MPPPAGLLSPAPFPGLKIRNRGRRRGDARARASRSLRLEVDSLAGGKNDNSA
jgi:hypothetical protein